MNQLDSIRAFTRVVDTGGFAAAARDLGCSRSSVSRQVADLERALGAQLLIRSTRQVSPTEIGLAFYDRCRQIITELDETFAAVSELQERPVGNLRVNAPMSFGTLHLGAVAAEFMAAHQEVRVELVLNDRFVDPIEEGFDVTVRIGEPQSSTSLIWREIAPAPRLLCAAPGYLVERGEPPEPSALRSHRCLHYGYQQSGTSWRLEGPDGDTSVPVGCVLWSNNGEVLMDAAVAGQGIALLPQFIVQPALADGRLVRVLGAYRAPDISICALYPRHRHLSAKTRLFVELLERRFGTGL